MDDFQILNHLLDKQQEDVKCIQECVHESVIQDHKGGTICKDCGLEVADRAQVADTAFYGTGDNSRCYTRKTVERTIHSDLQGVRISEHVKDKANDIFNQVCSSIRRANSRKGVVFGCVFFAFKACGNPQSGDSVIKIFNISKRQAQEGLKFVNENLPHGSPLLSIHVSEEDIMREFMNKLHTSREHADEVIRLYRTIKGKSQQLSRRKPQSIAAGMIYYYTTLQKKPIPLDELTKKVSLSQLTIAQTAKECAKLMGRADLNIK